MDALMVSIYKFKLIHHYIAKANIKMSKKEKAAVMNELARGLCSFFNKYGTSNLNVKNSGIEIYEQSILCSHLNVDKKHVLPKRTNRCKKAGTINKRD